MGLAWAWVTYLCALTRLGAAVVEASGGTEEQTSFASEGRRDATFTVRVSRIYRR